jgi:hypothetical protein
MAGCSDSSSYPFVIGEFFMCIVTKETSENKGKLSAKCKKCKKLITADWKPSLVTSNFVSHAKV